MAKRKQIATKQPKQKASRQGGPRPRAGWSGNLTFGLVTFPVEAFNAVSREQGEIHFHLLHKGCHRRIKYQKVCPVHGEISNDDIVSGYEYQKDHYVEIAKEELDELRTERERSLTIDTFIGCDAIDLRFFDGRMYYLAPDGAAAEEPYAVMTEALAREKKCGVGQMIFSSKEQLALIRPQDGILHLAMLNYDEEIRDPAETVGPIEAPSGMARKVELAQSLIDSWTADDFDFTHYDDPYRERVQALIEAKLQGRTFTAPKEETAPPVINLMDALKKSLSTAPTGRKKTKSKAKRRSA
ncbi:MAG TPA: Ku protein [Pirellulaceae bacterium]|nr:Ku protein [Pirellulaceae bacterium]